MPRDLPPELMSFFTQNGISKADHLKMVSDQLSMEDLVWMMLWKFGEDPSREGLRETPQRVAKAWEEWTSGYGQKPEDIIKQFEDGAETYDEMIVIPVPLTSHCEHHLASISGEAIIGYIPNGHIVGLSKFKRLVDIYANRLQVQERLTDEIASAIEKTIHPRGVGVVIRAKHMCMESRGVRINDVKPTITCSLRGAMKDKPEARAEFMAHAK